ncbi:MAG TPA: hypothetical protein VMC05_09780 [Xanthobacteraceae bacterium]|nr:hypothetical protein [Xanthobacteraceae bacterium]
MAEPPSRHQAGKNLTPPGGRRIHLLTNRDSSALNVAALQQQLAERAAATRLLNRRVEALAAESAAADAKIADLDRELAWANEERAHRDNEINSLQRSVELTMAENARLTDRLADCEGAVGKAYVQLEQMKAALIATERERAKSATAVDRVDQKHRNETANLNARLESMTSCAATADKLLAGMRRNLREKLELLQNLLAIKDGQLDELRQSRANLVERTGKLLEAFRAREGALAAAEETNKALAERAAGAQAAAAKRHKSLAARLAQAEAALRRKQEELENARLDLQSERKKRRAAEAAQGEVRAVCAALQRKLEHDAAATDDAADDGNAALLALPSAGLLPMATITL